jgi:hypothetical protein
VNNINEFGNIIENSANTPATNNFFNFLSGVRGMPGLVKTRAWFTAGKGKRAFLMLVILKINSI